MIDRLSPARETSYGNAGVINSGSMIPINSPGIHKSLFSLLQNNKPQLRYNLAFAIKKLPWIVQFLQASKSSNTVATTKALSSLSSTCLTEHKALMQRVGNAHRLTEAGWLKVFRSGQGYDPSSFEAQQLEKYNIPIQKFNADELRELEPSLKPIYSAAYLLSDAATVNNPGELLAEYAEQFVKDGGKIEKMEINSIDVEGENIKCRSDAGVHACEKLVIAAGPWSSDLLNMLNYTVPLNVERGYHAHFHLLNNATLGRSIHDVQGGFVMGPMEMGLRVTTGVELNYRDAENNLQQLEQVIPSVKQAIDIGERTDDPVWRGNRPTLPDSMPVIGQAPDHNNVWMAFGHNHIGLMTGPITGRLLAEQISGETSDVDLTPFTPKRYVRSGRRRKPIWKK